MVITLFMSVSSILVQSEISTVLISVFSDIGVIMPHCILILHYNTSHYQNYNTAMFLSVASTFSWINLHCNFVVVMLLKTSMISQ